MSDNHKKLIVFLYLSVFFFASGAALLWLMNGGLKTGWNGQDWTVIREYLFYAFAGSMGGSLYSLRLFHQYYENELNSRFMYWYFMRPYLCGGTAMITVALFDSGIMLLEVDDSMPARIGISFLVGYGHGKFMEKLTQLTETLFNGGSGGNGNGMNGKA